jgi:hypothetical protein
MNIERFNRTEYRVRFDDFDFYIDVDGNGSMPEVLQDTKTEEIILLQVKLFAKSKEVECLRKFIKDLEFEEKAEYEERFTSLGFSDSEPQFLLEQIEENIEF